jgi:hypothetical protein
VHTDTPHTHTPVVGVAAAGRTFFVVKSKLFSL